MFLKESGTKTSATGAAVFIKKHISNHRTKRRMFLQFLYYCKKRRIPIYLTKTILKRTSNDIFNMKMVDLERGTVILQVSYK